MKTLPQDPDNISTSYKLKQEDKDFGKDFLNHMKQEGVTMRLWCTSSAMFYIRYEKHKRVIALVAIFDDIMPRELCIEDIARTKKFFTSMDFSFVYDKLLVGTEKYSSVKDKVYHVFKKVITADIKPKNKTEEKEVEEKVKRTVNSYMTKRLTNKGEFEILQVF